MSRRPRPAAARPDPTGPDRAPGGPPGAVAGRADALVERCRRAGMNVTPQRLAIYQALLATDEHPSPEALYERVRAGMPSLSLATIYKTLEALARLGLVTELPTTGNARRYDGNVGRHHHLVCTRCSRVSDYADPALDRIPPPSRLRGFTAHHVSVHIHGLCAACAGAAQPPSSPARRKRAWPGS